MEGSARYIEYRLYEYFDDFNLTDAKWLYTIGKNYYYATGFNLLRLLDKLGIEYHSHIFTDVTVLEKALREQSTIPFITFIDRFSQKYGYINNYLNLCNWNNEANPKHPVSVENCIMPAFALGGCNDYALLGALRDSWYDGHARRLSSKTVGSG